jgi:hypothetical protein
MVGSTAGADAAPEAGALWPEAPEAVMKAAAIVVNVSTTARFGKVIAPPRGRASRVTADADYQIHEHNAEIGGKPSHAGESDKTGSNGE